MKKITADGYVVPSDATRAVGRFAPDGVKGYQATNMENAPLRATRDEAVADWIAARTSAPTAMASETRVTPSSSDYQ